MKYDKETVENAVFYIVPGFGVAKKSGIYMNLPTMLTHAAVECFSQQRSYGDPPENSPFDWVVAQSIIREALVDIKVNGQLEFGEQKYTFGDK